MIVPKSRLWFLPVPGSLSSLASLDQMFTYAANETSVHVLPLKAPALALVDTPGNRDDRNRNGDS